MLDATPSTLPEPHRRFLTRALDILAREARILGVAAGGSYASDAMDEFSDLDLVLAIEPAHHGEILAAARTVAGSLGELLAAFTGEHVGEPRLLICLYDAPLLHVDLKFVALPDVARRVEDPVVLWERAGRLSAALRSDAARYPLPDAQWIEDRFWVWVHYGASKIARGELLEAIDSLSFLRAAVLGPLALQRAGARPSGVRKIETHAPEVARALARTVAVPERTACVAALHAAVDLYRSLRGAGGTLAFRREAEDAALRHLGAVAQQARRDADRGRA